MQHEDYTIQMKRIMDHFGQARFSSEFTKLLWFEIRGIDAPIFEKAVSHLIAEAKNPPRVSEFKIEIAKAREAHFAEMKRSYNQPMDTSGWDNSQSVLSPEDIKEIFKVMRAAACGKITADQACQYADILRSAIQTKTHQ